MPCCRHQAFWSFAGCDAQRPERSDEAERQIFDFPVIAVVALMRRTTTAVAASGQIDPVFGEDPVGPGAGVMAIGIELGGKNFQDHQGSSTAHHQHSKRPSGSVYKPGIINKLTIKLKSKGIAASIPSFSQVTLVDD